MEVDILTYIDDSKESKAAVKLKEMLIQSVPYDTEGHLHIASNLTLCGQEVRDIDIAIWGSLTNYKLPDYYSNDEGRYPKKDLVVRSFFVVIELKGHHVEAVNFEGGHFFIKYSGLYKDVTQQNEKQRYAMKNYLSQILGLDLFISNVIWFNSVSDEDLHELTEGIPVGALPSDFGLIDLIDRILIQGRKPWYDKDNRCYILGSADDSAKFDSIERKLFTKREMHSKLTRKRLEILTKENLPDLNLERTDGQDLTTISGKAGTGKTFVLLQAAFQIVNKNPDSSCALLTYNHALVNDIRRLMYYLDIRDNAIVPSTLHSFFMAMMKDLSIDTTTIDGYYFEKNYKKRLEELYEYVKIADNTDAKMLRMQYNYILIDEAQDWDPLEKEILIKVYGRDRLIVADGGRQIIRNNDYLNWGGETIPLDIERRQKLSLVDFVNTIASENNITWEQIGDGRMTGGRVIVRRDYDPTLHSELTDYCRRSECENYDMLFLVPPQLVERTNRHSCFKDFQSWTEAGISLFDGTDDRLLDQYPIKVEECRMYQYESCRGLEGWVVVCMLFDKFIELKKEQFEPDPHIFASQAEQLKDYLWMWTMLPFTRAIDTLVITLEDPNSETGQFLKHIADLNEDIVHWEID